jgi:hypothetical protein
MTMQLYIQAANVVRQFLQNVNVDVLCWPVNATYLTPIGRIEQEIATIAPTDVGYKVGNHTSTCIQNLESKMPSSDRRS